MTTEAPSERALHRAKIVRWALIGASGLLAIAGILIGLGVGTPSGDARRYYCAMHPQVQSDRPGKCPICQMDLVPMPPGGVPRHSARLYCPRHPFIRSDVPGRCPLDGSELVSMPTVPGRSEVQLDPARLREIGIVSVAVEETAFASDLTAPAQIAVDESDVAVVDTRFAGWLTKLRVRTRGSSVRRGQTLATLRSPDLYQAEAELSAAARTAAVLGEAGQRVLVQSRERLVALGVPGGEIARVAAGGTPRTELPLVAPRSGVIVSPPVVEGSYVTPGTAVFTIANLDRVWVLADVAEAQASRVHPGDRARIESPIAPGRYWEGRVTLLEPLVDAQTRTRRARIGLDAVEGALVPGAIAYAHFDLEPRRALVVPRDAVLGAADESHVFVDLGGGRFAPRRVELGDERDGRVEVLHGLALGERVASVAAFILDAESQLRATAERGGAVTGEHAEHGGAR